jgi:Cu/Ag efflux protein CusF
MMVGALVIAGLAACEKKGAALPPPPTTASSFTAGKGTWEQQNTVTVTATVAAINHKTREVTLRGPDGNTDTIRVSDQVQNLNQVKKGDQVVATYYESIAIQVKKPGQATPGISAAEGGDRAKLGEQPGAAGVRVISVTATITGIDRKTQVVTLKGPRGKIVHVHVKDPSRLENVKKGDLVEITYTEGLAIDVHKA